MKKFLLIAAMVVSTVAASAQNEQGGFSLKPMAGISITNLTNLGGSSFKPGFVGGIEAEYGATKNFGVALGLVFNMQGAKREFNASVAPGLDVKTKYTANLNYLNIPVLAKFYVIPGLAIQAGIQPGFLLSAKEKYDGKVYVGNQVGAEDETIDIKDICKTFDFSIPVGLTYEMGGLVLDARYNIGVTNVNKYTEGNSNSKNSVFAITLGYRFSL